MKEAIEGCFEARQAELKHHGEAGRSMSSLKAHIIPTFGRYPIEDIDQHVLKETLWPILHKKPQAAEKALQRLVQTLRRAAALGLNVGLQAAMKTRALLGKQPHEVTHNPSLPHQRVTAFYQWLKTNRGVAALALRFLMLTLARTSKVRLATFDEIEGDIWSLAPSLSKSGIKHKVPLTDEALEIVALARTSADGFFHFSACRGKPLSDAVMSVYMKQEVYEARPHGFLNTFRTWVEEQTETPFEMKEACLGHVLDDGLVRANSDLIASS